MLHQTLPVFFQFNHSSSPPLISLPPHTSLSSSHQVSEMEGKALKTSFWTEMSQELGGEDVWGGNGTNGVSGDDFFVDELLNFSKEEEGLVEEEEDKDFVSVSSLEEDISTNSNGFSLKQGLDSLPASELSVPTDDIADLEWLSHFVDDSPFTDFSLLSPPPKPKPQTQNHSEPEKTGFSSLRTGTFPTPIPVKARTKRLRSSSQAWSTTSSSSAASASSSPTSCLIFTNTNQNLDLFYSLTKPSEKKQKKRHVAESGGMMQRRCSHCGVQKTPQWRTGPLGAKTLCNACGVRFKSGRLLPEYRPACSPTFSSEVHSNNHRKVLEMRKKKEMMVAPESGLAPAVQSF